MLYGAIRYKLEAKRQRKAYDDDNHTNNHAHLSRVESGKKAPSIMVLLRLADILDIRVERFFEGV